jgi:hypothetical protein
LIGIKARIESNTYHLQFCLRPAAGFVDLAQAVPLRPSIPSLQGPEAVPVVVRVAPTESRSFREQVARTKLARVEMNLRQRT